jgi:hypothetical protein
VVLFVVWGVNGEVGAAGAALRLSEDAGWPQRLQLLTVVALMACAGFMSNRARNSRLKWSALTLFLGAFVIAFADAGVFASIGVGDGPFGYASAIACIFAIGAAVAKFGTEGGAPGNGSASIYAQGQFQAWFSSFLMFLCYVVALALGGGYEWPYIGPVLLFGCVLTLVNAPFDWLSVGLTRALLRRGVEAGGFAPLWLAMVDLLAATVLIIVLAAVMVFAVDLFEVVGRAKIIDVNATLMALADPWQRGQTQYWWIYATLFSTLIPSVLNMTVAALSLMRGVPWFHKRVAAAMRPGKSMMEIHLSWMPGALALEVMLAAMAGLAFTYWWIFKAVPWLTRPVEWLIPMLRWVAGLV